jgi:lipopolysaccharide export system ATP-binding protein
VVLLDEPFAGVDPIHVAELKTRIRALASAGLAVVLTDHAVADALGVVDRAVVLNGGVRQLEGSPAEIASHERVRERYLGSDFRL